MRNAAIYGAGGIPEIIPDLFYGDAGDDPELGEVVCATNKQTGETGTGVVISVDSFRHTYTARFPLTRAGEL